MSLRRKKPSLAEKIGSLVTAAPTIFGSDDENEDTKAKVVDNYDETDEIDDDPGASTIRRRNVDLLEQIDDRYKGKKVSRKDIYESEDDSEVDQESESSENDVSNDEKSEEEECTPSDGEDEKSDEDEEMSSNGEDETSDKDDERSEENEEMISSEESGSNPDEDSEVDEDNPLRRDRREANFKSVSATNVRAEIQKGNCVREQLKIWESLLETRIKLQKCLITGNKMPRHDVYRRFNADETFRKNSAESVNKLGSLLENLLELQTNLLRNYPETKDLSSGGKKRKAEEISENEDSDEEICSDTEGEDDAHENEEVATSEAAENKPSVSADEQRKRRSLAEYEKLLAENHEAYRDYRNSVIQKWNDKTRVASGSLNKGSSQAIVKQIEFVLGDREKLLKRTRLKRSEYEILGEEETAEAEDGRRQQDYDSEIYDDDDFYHQLLRELIEYKSSDITDPVQLSKQWIALQNMRNKMKRKIDTRATKGRRIRYNVHTKLVNFMAPITVDDKWSDLAKNELYNSLFGKIKSTTNETAVDGVSGDN